MEQKQIVYDQIPPLSPDHQWVVVQNLDAKDDPEVQIFCSVNDPHRHFRCRIPELLGKHVRGCFYGWVILSDHPHNVMCMWSLWNPVTSKVINFPRLIYNKSDFADDDDDDDEDDDDIDYIEYCCLTSPPDDPNSVLLMTRTRKQHLVFCRLHPKNDKLKWTEMSYAKLLKKVTGEDSWLSFLTCCNGKVYASVLTAFLAVEISIVVTDSRDVINLLPLLEFPDISPNGHRRRPYLVGTFEDLFTVYLHFERATGTICDVHFFKLDVNSKTWEELEDLNDANIIMEIDGYLHPEFHSLAIGSELGGYIHILGEYGGIIYSYHVKDKTISLSSLPSLGGTAIYVSTWAMLESKRLLEDDHKQEEDKKDKMVVSKVTSHETNRGWPSGKSACGCHFKVDEVSSSVPARCKQPGCHFLKTEGIAWFESVWQWVQTSWVIRPKNVKTREVEFIRTTDESHLLNLPFDVLEMIIGLCVGVEYMNFRASCKPCYLAAPIIQWSNQTASKRLQLQQYSLVSPWLMVFGKHTVTLFDPIFGDKYFINTPRELEYDWPELKIHCSRYGWLLMGKDDGPLFFFNPFTSDTRKLPDAAYLDSFDFSAPPTSPDCMVVGFTSFCEFHVRILFVGRESSWREYALSFGNNDPDRYRFPAFYGGDVYALCDGKGVHVFKGLGVEDHNWEWKCLLDEVPISSCTSKAQHFLVKCDHEFICDQHLLLVIVGELGDSVEVFILNENAAEWDNIDDIGRHMIYIGDETCLCMEAKTPKMENKIYFPRLHSEKAVFYSLETRKFHTFGGGNISESFTDFFGTIKHLPHNAWIEPAWS